MDENPIRVLLIEDNPGDARLVRELLLEEGGIDIDWADRLSLGLGYLEKEKFDGLLLDLSLPDGQGLDTLMRTQKQCPHIPVIIMTGLDDKELALDAVRKGAQDYIVKGRVDGGLIARAIRYAIECKKAGEALKNSEEKLRKILESSPDAIIVSDLNGTITECNQSTAGLLGYPSKTEVVGKNMYDLVSEKDRNKAVTNLERALDGTTVRSAEIHLLKCNGTEFPAEVSANLVRDITGAPTSLVTIGKDITERKRTEQLLKQHVVDLERSNQELSQNLGQLIERVQKKRDLIRTHDISRKVEDRNGIFLYPLSKEAQARSRFIEMVDVGYPTLAVVRTPPDRFCKNIGRDVETVWLTCNRKPGIVCVDPSNFPRLFLVFKEFFEHAPEGIVLFEGLEYILSTAGFKDLLNLVQFLNDIIATVSGSIYILMDTDALDEKDLRHLQRECLTPQVTVKSSDSQ